MLNTMLFAVCFTKYVSVCVSHLRLHLWNVLIQKLHLKRAIKLKTVVSVSDGVWVVCLHPGVGAEAWGRSRDICDEDSFHCSTLTEAWGGFNEA